MNRVWTTLLLLVTAAVVAGVVLVLVQDKKVPQAGQTVGYTPPATAPSTPSSTTGSVGSTAPSTSPAGSTSSAPSSTSSTSGATDTASTKHLVVFLGDDWTQSVGASSADKGFVALLAAKLHVHTKAVATTQGGYAKKGKNGDTYADLVDKVVGLHPDVVVVSGGRNDKSDDADTLKSSIDQLYSDLHAKLPRTKLVGVAPWWGDSDQPTELTSMADLVRKAVEGAHGTYIGGTDPIHGHPSYMKDARDPDDAGYAAVADSLLSKLKSVVG